MANYSYRYPLYYCWEFPLLLPSTYECQVWGYWCNSIQNFNFYIENQHSRDLIKRISASDKCYVNLPDSYIRIKGSWILLHICWDQTTLIPTCMIYWKSSKFIHFLMLIIFLAGTWNFTSRNFSNMACLSSQYVLSIWLTFTCEVAFPSCASSEVPWAKKNLKIIFKQPYTKKLGYWYIMYTPKPTLGKKDACLSRGQNSLWDERRKWNVVSPWKTNQK